MNRPNCKVEKKNQKGSRLLRVGGTTYLVTELVSETLFCSAVKICFVIWQKNCPLSLKNKIKWLKVCSNSLHSKHWPYNYDRHHKIPFHLIPR